MTSNFETTKTGSKPSKENPLDFRFSMEFFNKIPRAPGVFWMQDSKRKILFVGAAENLREELLQYKELDMTLAPPHVQELCRRVKQIDWNSTDNLQAAQDMNQVMLRQCQPEFNKKQKAAAPHFIQIRWKGPSTLVMEWTDAPDPTDGELQIFGPFFGRNNLHRSYSALVRWTWIVGNSSPAENIPPHLMKPLLKNGLEIPIGQLLFENQRWINSLKRFLNGHSDLFLDYGLRRVEALENISSSRIQLDRFREDLSLLDRFFQRYSQVNISMPLAPTQ